MPSSTEIDRTAEQTPRQRRWIPLSLRLFVALLVLPGLLVGLFIAVWIGPGWAQIYSIRKSGGWVETEPNRLGGWLRPQFGHEVAAAREEWITVQICDPNFDDLKMRIFEGREDL